MKERDHSVDVGVDGRIILRWILKKWDMNELELRGSQLEGFWKGGNELGS
jgi:hypothetical protein